MFLSKAESALKGLLSPLGHHKLNRMMAAGFPQELLPPLRFLLSPTLNAMDNLIAEKIEKIRSNISGKLEQYQVVRSSGFDSNQKVVVERKLGWLVDVASITKYWGTFLHLCANSLKAATILELGSCVGLSACYLASAESCKNFITIEGSEDLASLAEVSLGQVTTRFNIVNSFFDSGLDQVLPSLENGIDLVFVDGDHTKRATLHYFGRLKSFLNERSVILFDDIHWSPEMVQAWEEICNTEGLLFTVNLGRLGLCIWNGQKKKPTNYDLSKFTIEWGRGEHSKYVSCL